MSKPTAKTHEHERQIHAKALLVPVVKRVFKHSDVKTRLAEGKKHREELNRPDFVWHELLLSFATMGNSRGAEGLIRNKKNYQRVQFGVLEKKSKTSRLSELRAVLRTAKVRMPDRKASWLMVNFDRIMTMGGLAAAKRELLNREGREDKIRFWRGFKGIDKKYARNIMMDVYHPDFRNYIAVDERIKKISRILRLTFVNYESEETFYLDVAKDAGLEGWELDRMLYGFRDCILDAIEDAEDIAAAHRALKEKTIPWERIKKKLTL